MRIFNCFCILILLVCVSCGSPQKNVVSEKSNFAAEFANAPQWVTTDKCLEPWVKNPGQKLCGVGSHTITSRRTIGISKEAAKTNGRAAITTAMSTRLKTMLKDYSQEWVEASSEKEMVAVEQRTSQVTEQVAKMRLHGGEMADSWISPNDNFYALMVIDHEKALEALKSNAILNERQKNVISNHADELFTELKEE